MLLLLVAMLARGAMRADRAEAATFGAPTGAFGNKADTRVLESSDTSLVLEFSAPEYRFETARMEGGECQRPVVDGFGSAGRPGWPDLPVRGILAGIPPGAQPTLELLDSESLSLPGHYTICPEAQPIVETDANGQTRYAGEEVKPDPQAYANDAFFPAAPAVLGAPASIRSQQLVPVRFQPLQYNPASGALRLVRRLRVRLSFGTAAAAAAAPALPAPAEPASFENLLRSRLVNYRQARAWRAAPAGPPANAAAPDAAPAAALGPRYKILVDRDGIYQVSYEQLPGAGLPAGDLTAADLRLTNGGAEVAIQVSDGGDGSFGPGDSLLFFGQKTDAKYSTTNAYFLDWPPGPHARITDLDGTPGAAPEPADFRTTAHIEEDLTYWSTLPSGPGKDHWYQTAIYAPYSPTSVDLNATLAHIFTGSDSITVRGVLKGYSATPQHHTRVSLNGHLLEDATWPAGAEHTLEVTAPSSILVDGANTITVEAVLDDGITAEQIFLVNWFEIDYRDTYTAEGDSLRFDGDTAGTWRYKVTGYITDTLEAYDISQPLAPVRLTGVTVQGSPGDYELSFEQTIGAQHHYLAQATANRLAPLSVTMSQPDDLLSAANGADLVIISHPDFLGALPPLADRRMAQGFRVKIVNVQDVYDLFGDGTMDPQAIHDFLAYTLSHWTPPAPSYVLLVGDGHWDPKDNLQTHEPVYMPPYLADADPWVGETAADNRYVTLVGDDILPDMYLGRLPVRSPAQAQTLVGKILGYDNLATDSGWNKRLAFIADNADSGGDFAALSDGIANGYVPPDRTVQKVYYGIAPYTDANAAHNAIIGAINQGPLIVSYVGHATIRWWANENLLHVSDLPSLTNAGRLPLFVPMTCMEGYFLALPALQGQSLAEELVVAAGKGAIASWSPTGWGLSSGHDLLERGLFTSLFGNVPALLGPATTEGKLYLYANSAGNLELYDTYLLLGDPTTALKVVPGSPTAVTVASFSATPEHLRRSIELAWETVNEVDTVGFHILRAESSGAEPARLDAAMIAARWPGQTRGSAYRFEDNAVQPGVHYQYWLQVIGADGTASLLGPAEATWYYTRWLPLAGR